MEDKLFSEENNYQ